MMVASRNQQHVMHRAFGSTRNGSLPSYGAVGELNNYLGNMPAVSMRGLGATPKPDMKPTLKGEIIDSVEFGSKFGWCAIYIIARNKKAMSWTQGTGGYTTYYAVQYVCPSNKIARTVGIDYTSLADAQAEMITQQESLRNTGVSSGGSGDSGLSGLGAAGVDLSNKFVLAAIAAMYIGADFPGARPISKQLAKFLREPKEAVQTGLLLAGFVGFSGALLSGGA
jgi:hypothetical protein